MDLKAGLLWLLDSGGAGYLAYWLIEHVGFLAALKPEAKRYAGFALTALLAAAAYVVAVACQYLPLPTPTVQGWAEALFPVLYGALVASLAVHGRLQLSRRAEAITK